MHVTPDLTPKEQKENKTLRSQLAELNKSKNIQDKKWKNCAEAGLNLHTENQLPPLRILYTNAEQFLNKRDLLLVHITSSHPPDMIIISEMLPKSPNSSYYYFSSICTFRIFSLNKF